MQRWLLAMKTKTDTRIVLLAMDATVRGYSQQVNVLCHDTVVFSSLFRVRMDWVRKNLESHRIL